MFLNVITCILAVLLLAAFCFWIFMGRETDVDDESTQLIKRILDVAVIGLAAFLIVCCVKIYDRNVKADMVIEEVPSIEDIELPELIEELPEPVIETTEPGATEPETSVEDDTNATGEGEQTSGDGENASQEGQDTTSEGSATEGESSSAAAGQ